MILNPQSSSQGNNFCLILENQNPNKFLERIECCGWTIFVARIWIVFLIRTYIHTCVRAYIHTINKITLWKFPAWEVNGSSAVTKFLARFETLSVVLLNYQVFCDITLGWLVNISNVSRDHSVIFFGENQSDCSLTGWPWTAWARWRRYYDSSKYHFLSKLFNQSISSTFRAKSLANVSLYT